MNRYVVTLHYTVAPGRHAPAVRDVLAPAWGPGHVFSIWGGDGLSVMVELRAAADDDAVEIADATVAALWPLVGAGSLRLLHAFPRRSYALVGARLGRKDRHVSRRPTWFDDRGFDDGPDTGGDGAGVREPRRPPPSPGHLSAEADLPGAAGVHS